MILRMRSAICEDNRFFYAYNIIERDHKLYVEDHNGTNMNLKTETLTSSFEIEEVINSYREDYPKANLADFPEDASFELELSNAIEKVITDSEYKHLKTVSERDKERLEEEIRKCIDEEPSISAYAIAKKLCVDEKNFNSFKIKVLRIYKKIHPLP